MRSRGMGSSGFGALEVLLVVVVVAIIGVGGWAVYRHEHKTKPTSSSTKTTTSTTKTSDPYAGWKTYCDNTYNYCFKYPTNWEITAINIPDKVGDEGSVTLLSPTQTVEVIYENISVKDSELIGFTATEITRLTMANQSLTLVGGYIPSSGNNGIAGNNIPHYLVVDTHLLSTYPLSSNTTSQFPANPGFTDQSPGALDDDGSLMSRPAVTIDTIGQAQAWLNSQDAKTSVQILESLYYSK